MQPQGILWPGCTVVWALDLRLLTPCLVLSDNNLGQVVHTYAVLFGTGQRVVMPGGWEGLALHWPCVADFDGLSTCRLKA